jgi:predicted membrane protein
MHWLHFRIWDLWRLALILIGCSMLWQVFYRRRSYLADGHSTINGIAIMSGFHRSSNSQGFRGGELTTILGGCEVDLRQASIRENEEAVIDIFAIWGGIEIRVPEDWSVTLKAFPFMGGIEDKTHSPKDDVKKRLLVKGIVIMGGAEINNEM